MITVKVNGIKALVSKLDAMPKLIGRAAESTLDQVAREGQIAVREEMPKVFDNPVPWTIRSVGYEKTRNHNMQADVHIEAPARMSESYLAPQVKGGPRKEKGFERALGGTMLVPTKVAKLNKYVNKYGNVGYGDIVQILSVLGKAETSSGFTANKSAASAKKNKKARDFVEVKAGNRGRLYPGVYERFQAGVGFGAKTKRTFTDQAKVWQKGKTVGKISRVIRARGLRPILIEGKQRAAIKPLLPFFDIVHRVVKHRFETLFLANLARFGVR